MRFHESAGVAFIGCLGTLSLGSFGLLGCSGTDGAPLGGPYGGTTFVPPPIDAAVTSTAGKSSRCKGADASAGGSDSSAAPLQGSDGGAPEAGVLAPTWTQIYGKYLQGCTGPGCHIEMTTAKAGYAWLKGQKYINGTSSNLVNPLTSCLKWYGGNMPPCGGDDAQAVADMNAWVAAGALNN